jgi:hypothetical protein
MTLQVRFLHPLYDEFRRAPGTCQKPLKIGENLALSLSPLKNGGGIRYQLQLLCQQQI